MHKLTRNLVSMLLALLAVGQWLKSYTLITTEADKLMAAVHDRMPVILHPGDFNRWLDREPTDHPPIDLLRPFPASSEDCSDSNIEISSAPPR